LRGQTNFTSKINVICPVQSFLQKYSAGAVGQIRGTGSRVLSHRGALANVINAGGDAVDAGSAVGRTARTRTAKSCGPDAPVLASSLWIRSQATVARKPVTGESTKEAVKTIAQGRPDCLR
jgi:hypothetical protein